LLSEKRRVKGGGKIREQNPERIRGKESKWTGVHVPVSQLTTLMEQRSGGEKESDASRGSKKGKKRVEQTSKAYQDGSQNKKKT